MKQLPVSSLPAKNSGSRRVIVAVVVLAVAAVAGLVFQRSKLAADERARAVNAVVEGYLLLSRATALASTDVGMAQKAAALFSQAITVMPDDAKAVFGLAWALQESGRRDESEKRFQEVAFLAAKKDEVEIEYFAHYQLGVLYLERGEPERALGELSRATPLIDKKPRPATNGPIPTCIGDRGWLAFYDLGRAYAKLNVNDRAAAAFTEASKRKPLEWKPFFDLGMLRWKMGEKDAARSAFSQAERLNPDLKLAIRAIVAG